MADRSVHDLSAGEIERFCADYTAGVIPIADIVNGLRISMAGAYQIVYRRDLKRRLVASREKKAASALTQLRVPEDPAPDLLTTARALERQVVEQLLDLQRRAAEAPAAKAETLSRAIANQTRALKSIRDWTATLNEEEPTDDAPPPRDLGELRDELRRHLERIRAEERGPPELRGDPEPD